jgi:hypothetical protein
MKIIYQFLILFLFASTQVIGQTFIYDTTDNHYAGVNFTFKDDLKYWTYKLHSKKPSKKDQSIGYINFWRTEKWDDNADKEFHMAWNPGIGFEIFDLKDSSVALNISRQVRLLSSCVAPHIGGDYFVVGNFIFVNSVSCVSCYRGKNSTDYCRPTIYRIFKNIDLTKISSLTDIVQQLGIKRSE